MTRWQDKLSVIVFIWTMADEEEREYNVQEYPNPVVVPFAKFVWRYGRFGSAPVMKPVNVR
jgi:hypothetical protein